MEETCETRDRKRPSRFASFSGVARAHSSVIRSLCASGLVLSLGASAPLAALSADTATEADGSPVRSSVTATEADGSPASSIVTPTEADGSPASSIVTPTEADGSPVRTSLTPTVGDGSPVLRSTVTQTERRSPQSPTVNTGDVRVVAAGTVLELALSTEIASGETVQGDEFFGKISKDVTVDGQVVIPYGTVVHGVLTNLEGPKRAGRNGYINTRFDYLITPDGREVPIEGNSTTRDSRGKAAARVVGRAAGYTAFGGVVGTMVVLKYGGIAAAAASHGVAPAAGAAVGGAAGLTTAIVLKGRSVMLPPGAELHVKLSEPLKLPTMNMPDVTAEDFSLPGLKVKVDGMRISRHPLGELSEITLMLDILNETESAFSTFEIGLEDEQGHLFLRSPLGDSGMWFGKIEPSSHVNCNITFSVDNAKSRYKLVFFKPYSREPVAKFALTDAMLASGSHKGKRVAIDARETD